MIEVTEELIRQAGLCGVDLQGLSPHPYGRQDDRWTTKPDLDILVG